MPIRGIGRSVGRGLVKGAALGAGMQVGRNIVNGAFNRRNTAPTNQLTVNCATCGTNNPSNNKFCGSCGNDITARSSMRGCQSCGAQSPHNMQFCGGCGQRF